MSTSIDPPSVATGLAPQRHSYSLIREAKEFVVNIPTMDMLKETFQCETTSGRDHDKFERDNLDAGPARK